MDSICPRCDDRKQGTKLARLYGVDDQPYVTKVCDACFNIVTGPGEGTGIRLKVELAHLPDVLARLADYALRFRCCPTYHDIMDAEGPTCVGLWIVLVLTDCREALDDALTRVCTDAVAYPLSGYTPIHKVRCQLSLSLCNGCF